MQRFSNTLWRMSIDSAQLSQHNIYLTHMGDKLLSCYEIALNGSMCLEFVKVPVT